MPLPGETRASAEDHSSQGTLPLFRPEALAAQQQKFCGEVILLRPLPLMLLGWFGIGITAAILGFLLLGQYTERGQVRGIVVSTPASGARSSTNTLEAELYVPGPWAGQLRSGSQVALRCDTCSMQFARQTGTVLAISDAPLAAVDLSRVDQDMAGQIQRIPMYKVKVSLPPQAAPLAQLNPSPQTGTRVEAEIPLGRKPLIKWLFERSGS